MVSRLDRVARIAMLALLGVRLGACAASSPAREPAPAAPRSSNPAPDDPVGQVAAATVDRQLAAYNAHDLEGFLGAYADSVTVQNLGDTVTVRGKTALRKSTEEWFARAPQARSEPVNRMVIGPFVVNHERLTGASEGSPIEVIGIYEVRDSLIRRVWFIPPAPRTE